MFTRSMSAVLSSSLSFRMTEIRKLVENLQSFYKVLEDILMVWLPKAEAVSAELLDSLKKGSLDNERYMVSTMRKCGVRCEGRHLTPYNTRRTLTKTNVYLFAAISGRARQSYHAVRYCRTSSQRCPSQKGERPR